MLTRDTIDNIALPNYFRKTYEPRNFKTYEAHYFKTYEPLYFKTYELSILFALEWLFGFIYFLSFGFFLSRFMVITSEFDGARRFSQFVYNYFFHNLDLIAGLIY